MRTDVSADLATTAHQVSVEAALVKHEPPFQRAVERAIRMFTRDAMDAFERQAHRFALGRRMQAADVGQDPPDWRMPVPQELLDTQAAQADLEQISRDHRDRAATTTADGMAVELGIDFELKNRLLHGVIASQSGMHITTAPQDLVEVLMARLQRSYDEGDSIPRAARAMRAEGYTHAKGYGERIARTELVRATNASSLAMVQGATDIPYKVWMAQIDGRTRPTHKAADSQTVPIDSTFVVGSSRLEYPGDPRGPGEEVIQCRCTMGYTDTPNLVGGAMAAVDDTTTDEGVGASWSGVIAQEGVDTGDGRRIEPGALKWRSLPLTLMGQKTTPEWGGHAEAAVSGRIDAIARAGENINGEGVFDTGEWGADIERLVREGMLNGISVDLAVNEAEIIPDPDIEDEIEAWFMGTLNILDGTILGATIVPFPAFENASISIVASAAGPIEFVADDARGRRVVRNFHTSVFAPFKAKMADDDDELSGALAVIAKRLRGAK